MFLFAPLSALVPLDHKYGSLWSLFLLFGPLKLAFMTGSAFVGVRGPKCSLSLENVLLSSVEFHMNCFSAVIFLESPTRVPSR